MFTPPARWGHFLRCLDIFRSVKRHRLSQFVDTRRYDNYVLYFTLPTKCCRETVQRDTTFIQGGRNGRVYNTIGLSFCKPHSTGVHAIGAYSWLILLHHDNHFALCFVYVITFWSHHICCAVVSEPVSSDLVYSFPTHLISHAVVVRSWLLFMVEVHIGNAALM